MGSKRIGRSCAYFRRGHGRCNSGSRIVKHNAIIENQLTVVHEVMAAGKRGIPLTIRIEIGRPIARPKSEGSCRSVADCRCILQDLLHACIRCKWFSFLDADRGKESHKLWIKCIRRLILNHRIQLFIEVFIVRMNRIELFAREVVNFLLWWLVGLRKRIAAKAFFEFFYGRLQIAVFHKNAHQ